MKCEEFKLELPGLLWGELNEDERNRALKHISQCESCRREWMDLKSAEAVMNELGEEEPSSEPVFILHHSGGIVRKIWDWVSAPGVLRWGMAAALVIIALWVVKPSVSYREGDFNLAFGPGANAADYDEGALEQRLQSERLETLRLVSQILKEQSEEQRRDFNLSLTAFAQELEKQRRNDLTWMRTGLSGVQKNSQEGLMMTNFMIEDLMKRAAFSGNDTIRR